MATKKKKQVTYFDDFTLPSERVDKTSSTTSSSTKSKSTSSGGYFGGLSLPTEKTRAASKSSKVSVEDPFATGNTPVQQQPVNTLIPNKPKEPGIFRQAVDAIGPGFKILGQKIGGVLGTIGQGIAQGAQMDVKVKSDAAQRFDNFIASGAIGKVANEVGSRIQNNITDPIKNWWNKGNETKNRQNNLVDAVSKNSDDNQFTYNSILDATTKLQTIPELKQKSVVSDAYASVASQNNKDVSYFTDYAKGLSRSKEYFIPDSVKSIGEIRVDAAQYAKGVNTQELEKKYGKATITKLSQFGLDADTSLKSEGFIAGLIIGKHDSNEVSKYSDIINSAYEAPDNEQELGLRYKVNDVISYEFQPREQAKNSAEWNSYYQKLSGTDLVNYRKKSEEQINNEFDGSIFGVLKKGDVGEAANMWLSQNTNRVVKAGGALLTGATAGIVKPQTEAASGFSEKALVALAGAAGSITTISGIGKGVEAVVGGGKLATFISKYPTLEKYVYPFVKNVLSFDIYSQMDPDIQNRLQQLGKDILVSIPFTGLGLIKSAKVSIPASFTLGYGLAKLDGADNQDAIMSGFILAGLDAAGRTKGTDTKQTNGPITAETADISLKQATIKKFNEIAGTKYKVTDWETFKSTANKDITKMMAQYHPDKVTSDPVRYQVLGEIKASISGKPFNPEYITGETKSSPVAKTEKQDQLAIEDGKTNDNMDIVAKNGPNSNGSGDGVVNIPPVVIKNVAKQLGVPETNVELLSGMTKQEIEDNRDKVVEALTPSDATVEQEIKAEKVVEQIINDELANVEDIPSDIEPSVLQIRNIETGVDTFKVIPAGQLESFKEMVDRGVAGENVNGEIYHLTAKTPDQMSELGFTYGGVATLEEIPKGSATKIEKESLGRVINSRTGPELATLPEIYNLSKEEFINAGLEDYKQSQEYKDLEAKGDGGWALTTQKNMILDQYTGMQKALEFPAGTRIRVKGTGTESDGKTGELVGGKTTEGTNSFFAKLDGERYAYAFEKEKFDIIASPKGSKLKTNGAGTFTNFTEKVRQYYKRGIDYKEFASKVKNAGIAVPKELAPMDLKNVWYGLNNEPQSTKKEKVQEAVKEKRTAVAIEKNKGVVKKFTLPRVQKAVQQVDMKQDAISIPDQIKEIKRLLKRVNKQRSSLPILNNIIVDKGIAKYWGKGLEYQVETKTRLPDGIYSKDGISVKEDKYASIREDFPDIDESLITAHTFKINGAELKSVVYDMVEFISTEDIRPILSSMHIASDDNGYYIEALDTYKLYKKRIDINNVSLDESIKGDMVIPLTTKGDIAKIIKDNFSDGEYSIEFKADPKTKDYQRVTVTDGVSSVHIKLDGGEYPVTKQILSEIKNDGIPLSGTEIQGTVKSIIKELDSVTIGKKTHTGVTHKIIIENIEGKYFMYGTYNNGNEPYVTEKIELGGVTEKDIQVAGREKVVMLMPLKLEDGNENKIAFDVDYFEQAVLPFREDATFYIGLAEKNNMRAAVFVSETLKSTARQSIKRGTSSSSLVGAFIDTPIEVQKSPYRGMIPSVRGGWTLEKIKKYLKQRYIGASDSGELKWNREVGKYKTIEELQQNIFYHGTGGYVDRGLRPSIALPNNTFLGGGYDERYYTISLSQSKNIAKNFSGATSRSVTIYEVLLKKNAKVIDMPEIQDSVELEEYIVNLWTDGIDAVRLGDWNGEFSERELAVINPKAIVKGSSETFQVYGLGRMINPSLKELENKYGSLLNKENQLQGTSSTASVGSFTDFQLENDTILGKIKPIPLPELVSMVEELNIPTRVFESIPRHANASGLFTGNPLDPHISLKASLGSDPVQVARTLAHEVGHLDDWLPDMDMKRGNLLGRIFTLKKFMEPEIIGLAGKIRNSVVRKELLAVTQMQRPFTPIKGDSYTKYRQSGKELYADAISMFINNPTTLMQVAPTFMREMVGAMNRKPQVMKAFDDVYEFLARDTEDILNDRLAAVSAMAVEGEQKLKILEREAKKKRSIFYDINDAIMNGLKDKNNAAYDKIKQLQATGVALTPDENPFYDLEGLAYKGGLVRDFVVKYYEPVKSTLENAGVSWENFHQYLFLRRIAESRGELTKEELWTALEQLDEKDYERIKRMFNASESVTMSVPSMLKKIQKNLTHSAYDGKIDPVTGLMSESTKVSDEQKNIDKALFLQITDLLPNKVGAINPLGYSTETANAALEQLYKQLGEEKTEVLKEQAEKFDEANKEVLRLDGAKDLILEETLNDMLNSKGYATFRVIDYMTLKTSPTIYKTVGTLKHVANVATSTVMKEMSIIDAIERNRVKNKYITFLKQNFPLEVKKAKRVKDKYTGKVKFLPPVDDSMGLVEYKKGGKRRGVYVSKYIADAFGRNQKGPEILEKTIDVLSKVNSSWFRPVYTAYNIGFQSYNFIRDFQNYGVNMPVTTIPVVRQAQIIKDYIRAIPSAWKKAQGVYDPLVSDMYKNGELITTFSDYTGTNTDASEIDTLFEKMGVESDSSKGIYRELGKIANGIQHFGEFIEALPKVAGHIRLKETTLLSDKQLAHFVRNYVGSPNFNAKGTAYRYTNNLFLFSNAIKEGIRSSYQILTGRWNPDGYKEIPMKDGSTYKPSSGAWAKLIQTALFPVLLALAADEGLFGEDVKEYFGKISEYEKSNYIIIPLGYEGTKAKYIRVPMFETGRFLHSLVWKTAKLALNAGDKQAWADLADVFNIFTGIIPSPAPIFTVGTATWDFTINHRNPIDKFRGRNILSDRAYKAGGAEAWKEYGAWVWQQLGGSIVWSPYKGLEGEIKGPTDKFVNLPAVSNVLGRFIRVSDYGEAEQIQRQQAITDTENAKKAIEKEKALQKLSDTLGPNAAPADIKTFLGQTIEKFIGPRPALGYKGDQKAEQTRMIKQFLKYQAIAQGDNEMTKVANSTTTLKKVENIKRTVKDMDGNAKKEYLKKLRYYGLVSDDLLDELQAQGLITEAQNEFIVNYNNPLLTK